MRETDGRYRWIGEEYVYGMIFGEALRDARPIEFGYISRSTASRAMSDTYKRVDNRACQHNFKMIDAQMDIGSCVRFG